MPFAAARCAAPCCAAGAWKLPNFDSLCRQAGGGLRYSRRSRPPGRPHVPLRPSVRRRAWIVPALACLLLAACQSAYYGTMEKFGVAKRDILVDRVEAARTSQDRAQQAYVDALTQFRSVVAFDGGDLEATYDRLKARLDEAKARAQAFGERIDAVESVAEALFREWNGELGQYRDAALRAQSKSRLERTRARYQTVRAAMRRAQASFEPALAALNDQVLYLKHNLNAAAVGAIKAELPRMQADAERLRRDIEQSSAEADRFLREFHPAQ